MKKLLFLMLLLAACRPDPGEPDYGDQDQWIDAGDDDDDDTPDPDNLPGIVPFEAGDQRLSMGTFYEGPCAVCVEIDEVTNHFYIYQNEFTGGVTFQSSPSDDRVEGYASDELQHNGEGWMGGGIHWDEPIFLSDWDVLRVALKSDVAVFENATIGMNGGGTEVTVTVSDYGFVADGAWHSLEIPLADFAAGGADLSAVEVAMVLIVQGGESGDVLLIDDLYLTQLADE